MPTLQLLMGNPLHDKTPKPPVAVILGHVDHGKTTLLDALRHTSVAKTEAGNITQKISAFQVPVNDRVVTFIDTPGHAAYEAMRSRGAEVTDVAILLVAANEGVQLQTLEAIKHISRTKRPFVVCITKMDITSANSARCYTQLAQAGVLVDKLGGDILCAEVSAKTGEGLDQLLEVVLLQHEATDLKCNPDGLGYGVTLESYLDKAFGPTATILVKNGTFRPGDYLVAGLLQGKTKQLISTSTRKPMTSVLPLIDC